MKVNQRLLQEVRASGFLFPLSVLMGLITGGLVLFQAKKLSQLINGVFLENQTRESVTSLVWNSDPDRHSACSLYHGKRGNRRVSWQPISRKSCVACCWKRSTTWVRPYTSGETTGELTTTALQGVEALDAYFSQYLPQILIAALLPVMILFVVFPLDALTGVIFLVTAPLIPFFMALVGRASENETRHQWLALSRLGSYFLDTLQGITTLKTLGQSKQRTDPNSRGK